MTCRRDWDCLPTFRGPGVYRHHLLEGVMNDVTRMTWRGGPHRSTRKRALRKIRALPSNAVVLQFPIVLGSTGAEVRDRYERRQARTSCTRRVSASSSVVGGYASVFLGESGQWDNSSVVPFARSLAFPLPCCECSVELTPWSSSSSSLWYHGALPPRSCSSGEGGSDCKRTGEVLGLGERTRDMRG